MARIQLTLALTYTFSITNVVAHHLAISQAGAQQLSLFDDFIKETPEGYSNTVELLDAVLRFSPRRVRATPEPDIRTVLWRKKSITVTITPANIRGVMIMPGEREDLVEKAIRKLAAEDSLSWIVEKDQKGHPTFSFEFSMYRLRMLLKETNHYFKVSEIDQALRVLQGSTLEIQGDINERDYVGEVAGIFTTYRYVKRRHDVEGSKSVCRVTFHPLMALSIIERTFRRIDFGQLMRLKVNLARWIYQRMSHNYTQACIEDQWNKDRGYNLAMSTIIAESGMELRARMRDNVKMIRSALKELVDRDILHSFDEQVRRDKRPDKPGLGAVNDAVWKLRPSNKFIDDIISANQSAKKMRLQKSPAQIAGETRALSFSRDAAGR